MKLIFYQEDRKLTVKEEIELLKAINESEDWPYDDEIDELEIPDYTLD